MLSEKVEKALNDQIKKEGEASQVYLAMAVWAEHNGYEGTAKFLYEHALEERSHMMKIINYVNDREGFPVIAQIEQPALKYKGVKHVFEEVLKHEQMVTESINNIVGICYDERDFTTQNFLQWFVTEQIEEESKANSILDKLNLLGDDKAKMYMFDRDIVNYIGAEGEAE